ncbi:MAG: hypothetical protein ACE5GV_17810, partial [Candidatus Scalindua sp.]
MKKKKILVIDDEIELCSILERLFFLVSKYLYFIVCAKSWLPKMRPATTSLKGLAIFLDKPSSTNSLKAFRPLSLLLL